LHGLARPSGVVDYPPVNCENGNGYRVGVLPAMKVRDPFLPVAVIIGLAVIAAVYYYWTQGEREAPPPQTPPPAAETEPSPSPAEPEIRYPIESVESQEPEQEKAEPLPPLRASDQALQAAAEKLVDPKTLARLFHLNNIVRRFVVTVEELPRRKIGQRYNLAKPVAGHFVAGGKNDDAFLDPANYRRYAPYVALAEAVDTQQLVAVYVHFYPLFQEEYKQLGYPKRYFNDRLVETIDDLLAAPEIAGKIKLVQPRVMYEFADPALERLSAGQKIMIRMGPENAARIKAKLRELRSAIAASGAPARLPKDSNAPASDAAQSDTAAPAERATSK
jgi:hypothetical protein